MPSDFGHYETRAAKLVDFCAVGTSFADHGDGIEDKATKNSVFEDSGFGIWTEFEIQFLVFGFLVFGDRSLNHRATRIMSNGSWSRAPNREAVEGTRRTRWICSRLGFRRDHRHVSPGGHFIWASGEAH